jgi:hypothetical protein
MAFSRNPWATCALAGIFLAGAPTLASAATNGNSQSVGTHSAKAKAVYPFSQPPLPLSALPQPNYAPGRLGSTDIMEFTRTPWTYRIVYQYTKSGWGAISYSALAVNPTTLQPLFGSSAGEGVQPYFYQPPGTGGGAPPPGTSPPTAPPQLPPGPYPDPAPPSSPPLNGPSPPPASPCNMTDYHGVTIVVQTTYVWVPDQNGDGGGHWEKVAQQVKVFGAPGPNLC